MNNKITITVTYVLEDGLSDQFDMYIDADQRNEREAVVEGAYCYLFPDDLSCGSKATTDIEDGASGANKDSIIKQARRLGFAKLLYTVLNQDGIAVTKCIL